MSFADKIKKYRNENQLTQEKLAEKLSVSRQAVSKWEQGRGYPEIESLKTIAELLGCSIDSLISREETTALSIETSNRVKKSSKKFTVSLAALVVLLTGVIALLLYIIYKPEQVSEVRGVVGFYIDVDTTDGAFTLGNPNEKDIFYYKDEAGIYLKNGILEKSEKITVNFDGTSLLDAEFQIYVDREIAAEYVLYEIIESRGGILSAVRYADLIHEPAIFNGSFSRAYSISDTIFEKGVTKGRRLTVRISYIMHIENITLVQYAATGASPTIYNLFLETSPVVFLEPETRYLEMYYTVIQSGEPKEVIMYTNYINSSSIVTFPLLIANEYGYVSIKRELTITGTIN